MEYFFALLVGSTRGRRREVWCIRHSASANKEVFETIANNAATAPRIVASLFNAKRLRLAVYALSLSSEFIDMKIDPCFIQLPDT
jgi:hypothetical protein